MIDETCPADESNPTQPKQGEVMEKLLLSPEEAAEVLGVGRSTIYDLMRLKLLRSVKIGRYRKIPADACRELVDRLVNEEVA